MQALAKSQRVEALAKLERIAAYISTNFSTSTCARRVSAGCQAEHDPRLHFVPATRSPRIARVSAHIPSALARHPAIEHDHQVEIPGVSRRAARPPRRSLGSEPAPGTVARTPRLATHLLHETGWSNPSPPPPLLGHSRRRFEEFTCTAVKHSRSSKTGDDAGTLPAPTSHAWPDPLERRRSDHTGTHLDAAHAGLKVQACSRIRSTDAR
jgi:hypothetical protein